MPLKPVVRQLWEVRASELRQSPDFEVVKKIIDCDHAQVAKHQVYKTIEKHVPGARILSPSRVYCEQTGEDVPVEFRICASQVLEVD